MKFGLVAVVFFTSATLHLVIAGVTDSTAHIKDRIKLLKFQLNKHIEQKLGSTIRTHLINENYDYVDLDKVAITPVNEGDDRKKQGRFKLRQLKTTTTKLPTEKVTYRTYPTPQKGSPPQQVVRTAPETTTTEKTRKPFIPRSTGGYQQEEWQRIHYMDEPKVIMSKADTSKGENYGGEGLGKYVKWHKSNDDLKTIEDLEHFEAGTGLKTHSSLKTKIENISKESLVRKKKLKLRLEDRGPGYHDPFYRRGVTTAPQQQIATVHRNRRQCPGGACEIPPLKHVGMLVEPLTEENRNVPVKWIHCEDLVTPFFSGMKTELLVPKFIGPKHRTIQRLVHLFTLNTTTYSKEDIFSLLFQISNIQIRIFQWEIPSVKTIVGIITQGKPHSFINLKRGIQLMFNRWHMDLRNKSSLLSQARIFRPACINSASLDGSTASSKVVKFTGTTKCNNRRHFNETVHTKTGETTPLLHLRPSDTNSSLSRNSGLFSNSRLFSNSSDIDKVANQTVRSPNLTDKAAEGLNKTNS